jgi:hypothetical protein
MKIEEAMKVIRAQLLRMNEQYGRTVFDEWAVLAMGPKGGSRVLHYEGPREAVFVTNLPEDSALLRAQSSQREHVPGDFEFVHQAEGAALDAFLKLGTASYLVCNHTGMTMQEIRKDPRWLKAQRAWFALSEKFCADPME